MISANFESRVVERILADLTDRRGLRQEWENIDETTQVEIAAAWERIIREENEPASSVQSEREKFQEWARDNVGQPSFAGYNGTGGAWVYHHNFMQMCWNCWRAARATP